VCGWRGEEDRKERGSGWVGVKGIYLSARDLKCRQIF
jgi:hypothetical protein